MGSKIVHRELLEANDFRRQNTHELSVVLRTENFIQAFDEASDGDKRALLSQVVVTSVTSVKDWLTRRRVYDDASDMELRSMLSEAIKTMDKWSHETMVIFMKKLREDSHV